MCFFWFPSSAARSSAPLRSSLSATACTSSKPSTPRWSPAPSTPSSPTWPGEVASPFHPQDTLAERRNLTKWTDFDFFINRINTPRKQGGLGPMRIPLLSDLTHQISKDYGVYLEDQGHTLRYGFCLSTTSPQKLPVGNLFDPSLSLSQRTLHHR